MDSPRSVRLSVVLGAEQILKSKTRTVLVFGFTTTTLVLKGDTTTAADRVCGKCSSILVSQMEDEQFLIGEKESVSPMPSIRQRMFLSGVFMISETIETHDSIIVSQGGNLIIRCAKCGSFNEILEEMVSSGVGKVN
jgi:hypothetical protein